MRNRLRSEVDTQTATQAWAETAQRLKGEAKAARARATAGRWE